MDYLIEVRDTGASMQLAEEDWWYLLMLAGTFGWKPVAGSTTTSPSLLQTSSQVPFRATLRRPWLEPCLSSQKGAVLSTYRSPRKGFRSWTCEITSAENTRTLWRSLSSFANWGI